MGLVRPPPLPPESQDEKCDILLWENLKMLVFNVSQALKHAKLGIFSLLKITLHQKNLNIARPKS